MAADVMHPRDEIQLLLDGRLDPASRARVESHLSTCDSCRWKRDILAETRRVTRASGPIAAPPGLDTRLRAALEREDAAARGRTLRRRWMGLAVAACVGAIVALLVWRSVLPQDVVAAVAADFAAVNAGAMTLEVRTDQPAALESSFAARALPVRVFDLGMMGFRLQGGSVRRIAGRRSALYVYEGPNHVRLVCQMFEGRLETLPAGAEVRERNAITFRIYERNGYTLAFWQEGRVICVLASDLPREQLVDLAVAKAMKARGNT